MDDNRLPPQDAAALDALSAQEEPSSGSPVSAAPNPTMRPADPAPPRRRVFRFSQPARSGMSQQEAYPSTAEASLAAGPAPGEPHPDGEAERLRVEAVSRYQAFGSLRGAAFDDVTRLAAFICQTPLSLVSLVDDKRQWFLSSSGIDLCESSRDVSFCAHALLGPDMLIVPDARSDARFANNPLVTGEPGIRFYIGAPLVTPDGYTLGTLCVIDRVPRVLSREQKEALLALSRLTMTQLEMHRLKLSLANRV